ncbi:hypothetical protein INR49_002189 [Caranx melampygus]|nr:hypothetical protein INR49_002189 [Caranx melampygus]
MQGERRRWWRRDGAALSQAPAEFAVPHTEEGIILRRAVRREEKCISGDGAMLPLLQTQRRLVLPVHSLVCLTAFGLALPLAISLFPQMSQISVDRLEPEIAMFFGGL